MKGRLFIKTTLFALLFIISLILSACTDTATPEPSEPELKTLAFECIGEQQIPDTLEYEVKNIYQSAVIRPPNPSSFTTIFETDDSETPY